MINYVVIGLTETITGEEIRELLRMRLLDCVVRRILSYGAEIWGWK